MPLIEPYWVPVKNNDSVAVPPFGVMAADNAGINANGQLSIARPSKAGITDVLFNGPSPIGPGLSGQGHQTFPAIAAYNQSATPTKGDQWGTAANSWYLVKGSPGFTVKDANGGLANVTLDVVGIVGPGAVGIYDFNSFRNTGQAASTETPAFILDGFVRAPSCPVGNWQKLVTAIPNVIYAFPMPFPLGLGDQGLTPGLYPDPFNIWVDTVGSTGSVGKASLYKNSADLPLISPNPYLVAPKLTGGLIISGGDMILDATNGDLPHGYSTAGTNAYWYAPVTPGLYWVVWEFNSVGTMPIVGGCSTDKMTSFYGARYEIAAWPNNLPFGLTKASTYAAWNTDNPFGNTSTYDCNMIMGTQDIPLALISG
jgi:hypothetical protein